MNNKPKISKYQVTVGTEIKGFRRHAQMKKFVRTLDPATTVFKTEYWSGRTGVNGGYLPSWEWSTEGQIQYQANRAAHLQRIVERPKAKRVRVDSSAKEMAEQTTKQETRMAARTTRPASQRPKAKTIA